MSGENETITATTCAVELCGVGVAYEGKPALSDVTLTIPKNRITAIIGPSGCGKSTMLRCINGLIRADKGAKMEGRVLLAGTDTSSLPVDELRRRVGLVFQTPSPFPFSIYKNIVYAPRYNGIRDRHVLDSLVREKLQMAGLWEEVKDDLGKSALKLSGGQQQRLCIARALTVEPEVLLLDEPCSALDVKSGAIIEKLLVDLKERYTIVIVTHNLAQARRIADEVVFLYNGRMIEHGPCAQVFANPQEPETKDFLGGLFG